MNPLNLWKWIVFWCFLSNSFSANDIEYQTNFDTQYGLDQSASSSSYYEPTAAWSTSDTDLSVTEKQDELDMAVFETIRIILKLILTSFNVFITNPFLWNN